MSGNTDWGQVVLGVFGMGFLINCIESCSKDITKKQVKCLEVCNTAAESSFKEKSKYLECIKQCKEFTDDKK